jgi:hypothetical protein
MVSESSSGSQRPGSSVSTSQQQRELSVSCWPLRDSLASMLGLASIVMLATGVLLFTGQPWMSLFVLLVLLICTWRLWLPIRYDFAATGITRTCLGRRHQIPWYRVVRADRCQDGIRLYPHSGNSRLASLQALHIYSADQAESLHELLDRYLVVPETPAGD